MIGHSIAHYRIVEQLGQGGMGIVYKARDLHLDRFVAIKVLPPQKVSDPERRQRFIHEAKAASALNHPNIVVIHDIDESDGVYFIAMEYVVGETLLNLIRGNTLSQDKRLDYAIQIADALSSAHSVGIVHRDIKPSNVMVTGEGQVKILDFGLAKLTKPQPAFEAAEEGLTQSLDPLTGAGDVLGTLAYMSPEQALGEPLDCRTDIFSLGVVLYQMFSGRLPFHGPNAAATLEQLLHSPTPPLRSDNPEIPAILEQTVVRATAKNPDGRFQSMQEMASALRLLRGAEEPAATTLSALPAYPKRRLRPGRRAAILAIVAMAIALVFASTFRGHLPPWMGGSALPARMRLAVLPFTYIGFDSESQVACSGLMHVLATKLTQIEQFHRTLSVVAASEVQAENVASAAQARRALNANLALTGSAQRLRERLVLTVALVDAGSLQQIDGEVFEASTGEMMSLENEIFDSALSMLELKLNPDAQQVLRAGETKDAGAYASYLHAIGYLARYDIKENLDKAIESFQQALQKDPRYALAYAGLGEAYWQKFRTTKERQWADAALSRCRRAYELDSRVARVHVTLGMVYAGIGQPEKAVDELNLAISMEPTSADACRELGRAFEAMGKTDEAETTYKKAIQLQPDSWTCYWNLGGFYYRRARYEEAAAQFSEVIGLAPDHFRAYSSLGGIYLYLGKFDKAEQMFRKSLEISPTVPSYSNLAASCILQERPAAAVPLLDKAIAMGSATYEVWGNLGDAYSQMSGSAGKAAAAYKQASDLAENYLAVNSTDGSTRANLAFYLVKLGDNKRALREIELAGKSASNDQNIPFWAALVYEGTGDRERALKSLKAAVDGGYSLAIIRAVYDLRELRKDSRYRDLVKSK